jgi:hypothetical protein
VQVWNFEIGDLFSATEEKATASADDVQTKPGARVSLTFPGVPCECVCIRALRVNSEASSNLMSNRCFENPDIPRFYNKGTVFSVWDENSGEHSEVPID